MDMVTQTFHINTNEGFHLRPASNLSTLALRDQSAITFGVRGNWANAKSVLSILAGMVKQGEEVTFWCEGPDEEEAMKAIAELVANDMEL